MSVLGSTPCSSLPSVSSLSSVKLLEGGGELEAVFRRFAAFGTNDDSAIDNARFAKMCAEVGLGLPAAEVDLVFAKSKEKGARKLSFRHFKLRALPLLAERTGASVMDVVEAVISGHGPRVRVATPVNVEGVYAKLTDVDQYTGMYASRFGKPPSARRRFSRTESLQSLPEVPSKWLDELRRAFFDYCSHGNGPGFQNEMDSATFAKLCRECGLMSNRLRQTEVNLIFMRSRERDSRRIDFAQFARRAVPQICVTKRCDMGVLCEAIVRSRPRHSNPNQFRTDAGAYKEDSDDESYAGMDSGTHSEQEQQKPTPEPLPKVPPSAVGPLRAAFLEFAAFGSGGNGGEAALDSGQFAKMVRDAGVLEPPTFCAADADLVFRRACGAGSRRVGWASFCSDAVPMLARAAGAEMGPFVELLAAALPKRTSTTEVCTNGSVYEKLTDKRQYTGMYAERFGAKHKQAYQDQLLETAVARGTLDEMPATYASALRAAFKRFNGGRAEIGAEDFFRMLRDAKLTNHDHPKREAAVVFELSKERYAAALDFDLFFRVAVPLIALARDVDVHVVGKRLSEAEPSAAGVKLVRSARSVPIFDRLSDPDSYTGMYKERFSDRPGSSRQFARSLTAPARQASARAWSRQTSRYFSRQLTLS